MALQPMGAAYARISTSMQNEKSPQDQVRVCRQRAAADGVTIPDANVFTDRAISGTKPDRDALLELMAAAKARKFSVLYFEDLSRVGRECTHLMATLKELVHDGIRVVSVNEGIDSTNESWHILATILGLQHEQYVRDLGHRVRRGQSGAVLDDLSAGDICFGYTSEPVPGTENRARNRRPKMAIVIDTVTSMWVLQIFNWFALEKRSMNWIADELTRLKAPKDHRSTTSGWHHTYVKKILVNEKYIGVWKWGKRRNKRNPTTGKVGQVAAPADEVVVRERPDLRIIAQDLWDAVKKRMTEVHKRYPGPNGGLGRKSASYVDTYPKHEFSGLLFCSKCGARMVVAGTNGKYMACGGRRARRCDVRTMAPRAWLKALLIDEIRKHVTASRKRVDALLKLVHAEINATVTDVSSQLKALQREKQQLTTAIANLATAIESANGDLLTLVQRLNEREARLTEVQTAIRQLKAAGKQAPARPDRAWLVAKLNRIDTWLMKAQPHELAQIFRSFTGGRVEMTAVVPEGKKRGYYEVEIGGDVLPLVLKEVMA